MTEQEQLNKADKFFEEENYSSALPIYVKLLKQFPKCEALEERIGDCYYNLETYTNSSKYYEILHKRNPNELRYIVKLIYSYHNLGDSLKENRLIKLCEEFLKKKEDMEVKEILSLSYIRNNDYDRAEITLHEIIADSPKNIEALRNLAIIYWIKSNNEEALRLFSILIEIDKHNYKHYNNKGVVLTELKEYQTAVIQFEKAIKLSPHSRAAYNNLGYLYEQTGEEIKAMAIYKRGLRMHECECDQTDLLLE